MWKNGMRHLLGEHEPIHKNKDEENAVLFSAGLW
jgi:hypothetical protein